jgi:hypothetical protein
VIVVAVLLLVALGVAGWFAYTRYASPSRDTLVGKWEGNGRSTSLATIGNEKVKIGFTHTSRAEFRSDGTYTLESRSSSGGEGGAITLNITVPKTGEPPPKWELVRKDGRTFLKWHLGESEVEFQGNDSFTVKWSEPEQEGSETFRRVP